MLPAQQWQRCQSNVGIKWQCQCNDNKDASTTKTMMPAQPWQRHQQNGGKYARATMAITSMQQWQRSRCNLSVGWQCQLNYSKNARATRAINASIALAKMPMQQGWWQQHNKRNNASVMMAEMPALRLQWHQRNKGNNANARMAKIPVQQGQWHHCNNGKYASMS